jgi:hypothetical protein
MPDFNFHLSEDKKNSNARLKQAYYFVVLAVNHNRCCDAAFSDRSKMANKARGGGETYRINTLWGFASVRDDHLSGMMEFMKALFWPEFFARQIQRSESSKEDGATFS